LDYVTATEAASLPRFIDKIDKGSTPGECWNWIACKLQGYGIFQFQGKPRKAHRVSFISAYGEFAGDLHTNHLCNNRSCVNPEHMEATTAKLNTLWSDLAPAAKNAAKTHCLRGHPFDLITPGRRDCSICLNARIKKAQEKRKWRLKNEPGFRMSYNEKHRLYMQNRGK
jgi:hypothetical protein